MMMLAIIADGHRAEIYQDGDAYIVYLDGTSTTYNNLADALAAARKEGKNGNN